MTARLPFLRLRRVRRLLPANVVAGEVVAEQVVNWERSGVKPAECLEMLGRRPLPSPAWDDVAWALIETTLGMDGSAMDQSAAQELRLEHARDMARLLGAAKNYWRGELLGFARRVCESGVLRDSDLPPAARELLTELAAFHEKNPEGVRRD